MNDNFISNLRFKDKQTLLVASKETNTRIKIENRAYDGNNNPMKELCGVYSQDMKQDHSDMWVRFHELKNDRHARKILDLDYLRYRSEA